MFCVAHAEVLDFNELRSIKRVQTHLESTHSNAKASVRTNGGKGDTNTDTALQHRTEVELSYANGRKGKVKNSYNLT